MNIFRISLSVFIAALFCLTACQENIPEDKAKVLEQQALYEQSPSKETAAGYIAAATLFTQKNKNSEESRAMLELAAEYAKAQGQTVVEAGITNQLIKEYPSAPNTKEKIISLTESMKKIGKPQAANTLLYFYANKYPQDPVSKDFKSKMTDYPADSKAFLKSKADSLLANADIGGLNRNASFEYVDASEAFVLVNPMDPEASKYLFNAAEIAKTVGTYNKALSLYDWIISRYPKDEKAPTAQFLKAFILEDNMKNLDAARENYQLFIDNYPEHHFADDAKFSLENLGKSNEEIQKELEALQAKNANK